MAKTVRLDKFLADAGKGTRSEVKILIRKGLVEVNGKRAQKPEMKIAQEDLVTLSGENVCAAPEFVYYILNKPAGYVSATEDKRERTVLELVPSERKSLFPVGRLDKDTEGLLLITDDGALAHGLLSPKRHVDKTYFVRAAGEVTEEKRLLLEAGVDIGEEKRTLPARAEIVTGSGAVRGENGSRAKSIPVRRENLPEVYTELKLTIHEGKFHQVKRMLQAVGCEVIYLKRISMGPITLPADLKKGDCRPLYEEEIRQLKKSAGLL